MEHTYLFDLNNSIERNNGQDNRVTNSVGSNTSPGFFPALSPAHCMTGQIYDEPESQFPHL